MVNRGKPLSHKGFSRTTFGQRIPSPETVPARRRLAPVHSGTENTGPQKQNKRKNKVMTQLDLNGVASASKRSFAAVPVSFNPTRRLPNCARQFRARPALPARTCKSGANPAVGSPGTHVFRITAKKVLLPCAAAVLLGKTASYAVEACAFIWFMLR